MFGDEPPAGELRAVRVIPNHVAQRESFTIPTNMRVPADSVIHRRFYADPRSECDGREDLSQWESRGRPLEPRAVIVEARKVSNLVVAIVQPLEASRGKRPVASRPMFRE